MASRRIADRIGFTFAATITFTGLILYLIVAFAIGRELIRMIL